jgi:hypothetical protein
MMVTRKLKGSTAEMGKIHEVKRECMSQSRGAPDNNMCIFIHTKCTYLFTVTDTYASYINVT